MSKEKTLFLLDAMALIYRSHFALSKNPRYNSKGINTSAIMGFTNSLLEIITKEEPSHLAVAFDTHAPTFRHEQFEEYKATRQEQPEDIRIAIPIIKEMLDAFNIPRLELDGFEADDVIGTMAKRAEKEGFTVYMMTPDKDFGQLVSDKVFLYRPSYMGSGAEVMGIEEIKKKFDIDHVDQVRDVLGLQGDSIDNIPGIPGIGKKTASKFLKEFGSVENLIANVDQLKGKQKENVENFAEQGLLSKELATIAVDVPIALSIDELSRRDPKKEELIQIFEELEFRNIARRVFGEENNIVPENPQLGLFSGDSTVDEAFQEVSAKKTLEDVDHSYHMANTEEDIKKLLDTLVSSDEYCFDTETTSIYPYQAELVGIAFCIQKGTAWYVPFPSDRKKALARLEKFKVVFDDRQKLVIGQNLKYDIQVLKNYSVEIKGRLFDTMLAHYLVDPESRHSMDLLAETYLNYTPIPIEQLIGKKGAKQMNMREIAPESIVDYACEDADVTFQLKEILQKELKEHNQVRLFEDVEVPMLRVLAEMEYEGVHIDTDALAQMSGELEKLSKEVQAEIFKLADEEFNIASPKQLGEILFTKLKLVEKPKKTKSGQFATGEDILSRLAAEHVIASKILEFREYQKLKNTYVDALPKLISERDGRVHTEYRQTVAVTGRLSSNNPNLQNIPIRTEKGREIRKAFVPQDQSFEIMAADYSQIELRIMASFAGDQSMIEAFSQGRDIHTNTAAKVFKVSEEEVDASMRRKAKEVNFGIIYGISAFGLSQNLNIPRSEASEIISTYFEEFSEVKKFMDSMIETARSKGFVETILGRRRILRDINSRNATLRGYAERNAINTPIQGSAADVIKVAMVNLHRKMTQQKVRSRMIMQVHDELVFEVHKEDKEAFSDLVRETMQSAISFDVPLDVSIDFGKNWLSAH